MTLYVYARSGSGFLGMRKIMELFAMFTEGTGWGCQGYWRLGDLGSDTGSVNGC